MHRWVNGGYVWMGYGTFASTINTAAYETAELDRGRNRNP
jgi:hypothetical protein